MSATRLIRSWFVEEGKLSSSFISFLLLIAATVPLCWPALLNGYPLVYSDTGSYINSGFENQVPNDRPILYGLFIRHISLKASLWIIVFVQALLTASAVHLLTGSVISDRKRQQKFFVVSILLLSFTTGIAQKSSNLLPDFLTAIMCLVLASQLIKPAEGWKRIFVFLLFGFAMLSHASHLYILLVVLLLFFVLRVFRRSVFRMIQLRRLRNMTLLLLAGFLSMALINRAMTGRFYVSKNSSIFMTGHLADNGLLDEYLLENCGAHHYQLCSLAGSYHRIDFLWDQNTSPLYKMGGWENPSPEFGNMLRDFFTSPRYLGRFTWETMKGTCRQAAMIAVDEKMENPVMGPGSAPDGQIEWRYKHELAAFRSARQAQGNPGYQFVNWLQYPFVIISLLIIFALIFSGMRRKLPELYIASVTVICFYVVNAFVCSTFTIAHSRFGSRVAWLLPLIAILIIAEYLRMKKNSIPSDHVAA